MALMLLRVRRLTDGVLLLQLLDEGSPFLELSPLAGKDLYGKARFTKGGGGHERTHSHTYIVLGSMDANQKLHHSGRGFTAVPAARLLQHKMCCRQS